MRTLTPYAEVAAEYLAREWEVLPLPARSKAAPPQGYTGAGAAPVTEELALGEWLETGGNVALRMPEGVVGLDLDSYKDQGETIRTLTRECGALPETMGVSSHPSLNEGGTLFFTLPKGEELVGGVGSVDVIQRHHRYSVAPPSVHPSGREYRWVTSSGLSLPWVPEPAELPELPLAWRQRLAAVSTPADLFPLTDDPFTPTGGGGTPCKKMNSLVRGGVLRLGEGKGSRHDLMVRTLWALTQEAAKGHEGYERAVRAYQRAWMKQFSAEEQKTRPLELEFQSSLRGAQRKTGAPRSTECSCSRVARPTPKAVVSDFRMFR